MKNTGKQLERVVRLIEESFKDSAHTKIYSNYKIPNQSGRFREIDVLIVSKINGFEICIAIECKDFNSKIPVEKIEAFYSKCLRLKQINKMIFVSTKGYQEDALLAAKDFGIELLTAESLTADYIQQLIPIRQIKPIIHREVRNVVMSFAADEGTLKVIQESYTGEVFEDGNDELPLNALVVFDQAIDTYKKDVFGLALFEYMKLTGQNKDSIIIWPEFGLKFNGYYIKNSVGERIELLDAKFNVKVEFRFIIPEVISGRSLKHADGSTKADSFDIQIKKGLESHMVVKNDSKIDFFVTENKQTRKMQTLFTYDPKTDKITKPKE